MLVTPKRKMSNFCLSWGHQNAMIVWENLENTQPQKETKPKDANRKCLTLTNVSGSASLSFLAEQQLGSVQAWGIQWPKNAVRNCHPRTQSHTSTLSKVVRRQVVSFWAWETLFETSDERNQAFCQIQAGFKHHETEEGPLDLSASRSHSHQRT